MHCGIVWFEAKGFLKLKHGGIKIPHVLQRRGRILVGLGIVRCSRQRCLGFAQTLLWITQTIHQVAKLGVDFGKVRILLENLFIDRSRHGPFTLNFQKFSHNETSFCTAVCLERTIQLFGCFLILLSAH